MLSFPNAKINLGLCITEKRADGYHNLETVFYPLPKLRDGLEIVGSWQLAVGSPQLHISGLKVSGDAESNLVMKAWKLLWARFPEKMYAADIYLHKAIPMGAGLGGGSADGAFALKLLADFFSLGLSGEELAAMALELGSDCPFFIYNTPQFASGRGEIFTPVVIDLSPYSIQVVCPDVHVSTREAFAGISPEKPSFDLRQLSALPVGEWWDKVRNDFEGPVFAQHPQLAAIKQKLYADGAIYASMSGSGSAVYGIFEKGKRAEVAECNFFFE